MTADEFLKQFFAWRPSLEGIIFAMTRDYHATEDLLQEIAIIAVRKLDQFDDSRPLRPWLNGIVKIEVAGWMRNSRKKHYSLDPAVLEACTESFDEVFLKEDLHQQIDALETCMKRLSNEQKALLLLRYETGKECSDIAAQTNRTVQGVYGMLKRVKELLRNCIERRLAEERS